MALTISNPDWQNLIKEHRHWLTAFDQQHLNQWERILNSEPEAALCEAVVRRTLQHRGVNVEPDEDVTGGSQRPDFKCTVHQSGQVRKFYVEVTCIKIETVKRYTGLNDHMEHAVTPYKVMGMTEEIFRECCGKARQCGDMDAPTMVAIGTFHSRMPMVYFDEVHSNFLFSGNASLAFIIDVEQSEPIGEMFQSTALDDAAFLKPDPSQDVGFARESISGLLLCDLQLQPADVICRGLLHPNPARVFDPTLLPGIEYGTCEIDRSSKKLRVRWVCSE